jgi:hypothetical protein
VAFGIEDVLGHSMLLEFLGGLSRIVTGSNRLLIVFSSFVLNSHSSHALLGRRLVW